MRQRGHGVRRERGVRRAHGVRRALRTAAAAALLVTAVVTPTGAAQALVDESPPQLSALSFAPASIDVSAASAVVTTTLSITTGDQPFSRGRLVWVGPSGQSIAVPFDRDEQVPGPTWDEAFAVPTTFARGAEAGVWHLDSVSLWNTLDVEGPVSAWWLDYRGFPRELQVTSVPGELPWAPVRVGGIAGDQSVHVSWTPGVDPSGSVTGFRVTASPGGATAETHLAGYPPVPETSVDVGGLSNGVRYTFTVVALSPAGASAASAPSRAIAPRPVVTAVGGVVTEGDAESGVVLPFTVKLSSPSTAPVSVSVMTSGGSATPGQDYVITGDYVTVPPGSIEVAAPPVRIVGDRLHEVRETVRLRLSSPSNAVVQQVPQAQGVIIDDDPLPVLTVGDARVIEGDRANTELIFPVRLSEVSGAPASVAWQTVPATAAQPISDYWPASGRVVVPAGQLTATIRVVVSADRLDEPDETVLIRLSGPHQTLLARVGAVGVIVDDDEPAAG